MKHELKLKSRMWTKRRRKYKGDEGNGQYKEDEGAKGEPHLYQFGYGKSGHMSLNLEQLL